MATREVIDRSPMSRFQIRVVGICLVLNMIDGYDILVMAFAASGVAHDWGLSGSQVGLLLSSGLAGMALGSAFVAPLADRIGRRPMTLGCLAAATLGMALASVTSGFVELGICRLVAGMGIGGLVASLPVIIAEYTPLRRRGTAIYLYATGLPLGGVVGGAVAAVVGSQFGWRALFIVGATLTAIMLLVVFRAIPESLDYLAARQPRGALERTNALLSRMGHPPVNAPADTGRDPDRSVTVIFRGRNGLRTFMLWGAFFIMMASFYFAASWTPRLLEQSGYSTQQGISGGLLFNVGGVAATLLFGFLALFVARRKLTALSFVCAGLAFLVIGPALASLPATLLAVVAVGIFINACGAGLYTLVPDLYPAAVRTTAVGWASAVGRLGAITSPALAGYLVDRSWSPQSLFVLFAAPLLLAAIALVVATGGNGAALASAGAGATGDRPPRVPDDLGPDDDGSAAPRTDATRQPR